MKKILLTLVAAQTLMLAVPMTAQADVNVTAPEAPSINATVAPRLVISPSLTADHVLAPEALSR